MSSTMVDRITTKIEEAYTLGGLAAGQDKYRAYFINTALYLRYKAEVDATLTLDGFDGCIVTA